MSRPDPAAALNGTRSGNICDRCNRRVRTGDKIIAYATHYDADGWVVRRVWCDDCGDRGISNDTDGADESIIKAIFWNQRLVSVRTIDRDQPSK